jgi:prepilin-type N-terminal cleavage/methylation domain-containing protein
MRKGFTLIELLVVVLIIGILAAVALPKYRVSVEKSRAAEGFIMLKALYQAQVAYMLETGGDIGAQSFDELAVEVPGNVLGPSGQSARKKNGATFQFQIGSTATSEDLGNGYLNRAMRLPSATKYAIMTSQTAWYCCWYAAEYEQICRTLGFGKPGSAGTMGGALGCLLDR